MNLNGNKCLNLELRPGWVDCGNHEADVLGRAGGVHPGALAPCCFPRLLTSSAVLSLAQSRCFALKECLEVEVKGTKASFFFFWQEKGYMLHLSILSVTPERLECVPTPALGSISSYFCH